MLLSVRVNYLLAHHFVDCELAINISIGQGAHLPVIGREPVGGCTTKSLMCGQCIFRPIVSFPASEHHRL